MGRKNISHALIFFLFSLITLFFPAHHVPAQDTPGDLSSQSLVGTIRSDDFTGAVLINEKGEQTFYRVGDKLPDGSAVAKVRTDNILIRRNDGSTYQLFIVQASGKPSPGPATRSVSGSSAPAATTAVQSSAEQNPGQSYQRSRKAFKGGRRSRFR